MPRNNTISPQAGNSRRRGGAVQAVAGVATIVTGAALGIGGIPGADVVVAAGEALLSTAPAPSSAPASWQQQLVQLNQQNQQQFQQAMAQLQQQSQQQLYQATAHINYPPPVTSAPSFQQQLAQLNQHNQLQFQQAIAQLQQQSLQNLQQATAQLYTPARTSFVQQQLAQQQARNQQVLLAKLLQMQRDAAVGQHRVPHASPSARPTVIQTKARPNVSSSARPTVIKTASRPNRRGPTAYATARPVTSSPQRALDVQCPKHHPMHPTTFPGHICDVCESTTSNGKGNMASCSRCDWDICTSCRSQAKSSCSSRQQCPSKHTAYLSAAPESWNCDYCMVSIAPGTPIYCCPSCGWAVCAESSSCRTRGTARPPVRCSSGHLAHVSQIPASTRGTFVCDVCRASQYPRMEIYCCQKCPHKWSACTKHVAVGN